VFFGGRHTDTSLPPRTIAFSTIFACAPSGDPGISGRGDQIHIGGSIACDSLELHLSSTNFTSCAAFYGFAIRVIGSASLKASYLVLLRGNNGTGIDASCSGRVDINYATCYQNRETLAVIYARQTSINLLSCRFDENKLDLDYNKAHYFQGYPISMDTCYFSVGYTFYPSNIYYRTKNFLGRKMQ
jgi:hypothetical protein